VGLEIVWWLESPRQKDWPAGALPRLDTSPFNLLHFIRSVPKPSTAATLFFVYLPLLRNDEKQFFGRDQKVKIGFEAGHMDAPLARLEYP
jgi:hypothetical protein